MRFETGNFYPNCHTWGPFFLHLPNCRASAGKNNVFLPALKLWEGPLLVNSNCLWQYSATLTKEHIQTGIDIVGSLQASCRQRSCIFGTEILWRLTGLPKECTDKTYPSAVSAKKYLVLVHDTFPKKTIDKNSHAALQNHLSIWCILYKLA